MRIALDGMAVAIPDVEGHPNRAGFRGVLTLVDVPSEKAPSGSSGRRVVLTRAAAEAALPSLLGMAVDYAPTFDRHDVRRKVGVITSADIVGRNLEVAGFLYARDFPEIVEEIARSGRDGGNGTNISAHSLRARKDSASMLHGVCSVQHGDAARLRGSLTRAVKGLRGLARTLKPHEHPAVLRAEGTTRAGSDLGMSYEVTDVVLLDKRARVWTLLKVTFTGAAILKRSKAAYRDTWIELC
jgi:hypothetical protein